MALDFDLACTARLQVYDVERDKRMFEGMTGEALNRAFTGQPQAKTAKFREGTF